MFDLTAFFCSQHPSSNGLKMVEPLVWFPRLVIDHSGSGNWLFPLREFEKKYYCLLSHLVLAIHGTTTFRLQRCRSCVESPTKFLNFYCVWPSLWPSWWSNTPGAWRETPLWCPTPAVSNKWKFNPSLKLLLFSTICYS